MKKMLVKKLDGLMGLLLSIALICMGYVCAQISGIGADETISSMPSWEELTIPSYPAEVVLVPDSAQLANLRCELTQEGTLYCWDESGEIERWVSQGAHLEDIPLSEEPTILATDVVMVAVGRAHVVFLKADGSVWTFGNNIAGQIGCGTRGYLPHQETLPKPTDSFTSEPFDDRYNFVLEPVQVLDECVAVCAGNSVCAVLTTHGKVYTWGDNSCGQIGNGERGNGYPTASNLVVPSPYMVLEQIVSISFNEEKNCFTAIGIHQEIYEWGGDAPSTPTIVQS